MLSYMYMDYGRVIRQTTWWW